MSTAGIAHHQRKTFQINDDAACAARAARQAAGDAAYRAALGISAGEQLPARLGVTEHSTAGVSSATASGGRMRRRIGAGL